MPHPEELLEAVQSLAQISRPLSLLFSLQVQIYNPAFFKYIHDRWTEHHGRYPSTGMLVLFFALHVCDEVGSRCPSRAELGESINRGNSPFPILAVVPGK